ncbi:MAG: hypothetical protein IT265_04025 [Saprospiraceae bacterium]|nr:hypothetical protein [Saprospiraceae bacterium]
MSQSRQLAANKFTDIIGFTALMGTEKTTEKPLLNNEMVLESKLMNISIPSLKCK